MIEKTSVRTIPRLTAYAVILVAVLATIPSLLIPLGLPPEGDAVDYRVPILKWILRHASYPNWPWSVVDDYPMLAELLMLPFFWISPSLGRLIPIFAYIGSAYFAAKIIECFRTSDSQRDSANDGAFFLLSFAWFLSFRTLLIQSNLLMVDNVASCFVLGAIFYILRSQLPLAGLFCGLALATRYSAIPLLFPICCWMLITSIWKKNIKGLIFFSVLMVIPFFPFALRNWIMNQNPLFPLFDPKANLWVPNPLPNSFSGILTLPYYLFFVNEFRNNLFDYTLGRVFFIHGAIAISASTLRSWRSIFSIQLDGRHYFLLFFSICSVLTWYLSAQHLRFLVPTLLLLYGLFFRLAEKNMNLLGIAFLSLIGILSIGSVQKDSILMALKKRESIFESGRKKAEACYIKEWKEGEVVGHSSRDGVLGFFDYDFQYVPPHPYALKMESPPKPNWIFGAPPNTNDYEPWPNAEAPCSHRLRIAQ